MANNLQPWRTSNAKCSKVTILLIIFLELCLTLSNGFSYNSDIQGKLCDAQCEARCLDKVADCRQPCNGSVELNWMTNCDRPSCSGTCSILIQEYKNNKESLVQTPIVNISQPDYQHIDLSWDRPHTVNTDSSSSYSIIYIIERLHRDPNRSMLNTDSIYALLTDTQYQILVTEKCNSDMFRVMAINQFGAMGFSNPIKIPGIRPGPVQNLKYSGSGIYYYENKKHPEENSFMAILEWDPPAGWAESEIHKYVFNPEVSRFCYDVKHDSIPAFNEVENKPNRVLVTVSNISIGCTFHAEIKAVSKCGIHGPWTNFTIDLTNPNSIIGYDNRERPFSPPGNVRNVSLGITSWTREEIRQYFMLPYIKMQNPLAVFLHVKWTPPDDLGSKGIIDHYIIRTGKAKRNPFPLPADFIETTQNKTAPNTTIEIIFTIPTYDIPYTFGIQVIPVAPGQTIPENKWGTYPVYMLKVSRNDSAAGGIMSEGQILLDRAGIVVVYVNNTLPATIFFKPDGRMTNSTVDHFAVQWGPLVGPIGNKTMVFENETTVPFVPFDDGPVPLPMYNSTVAHG